MIYEFIRKTQSRKHRSTPRQSNKVVQMKRNQWFVILVYLMLGDAASAQFVQQGNKLVGTGATDNGRQGQSIAISSDGNTAIVGGSQDNSNMGAAWVWARSGTTWVQQGSKLVGSDAVGSFVAQGQSVAISADGNTAAVGGYADNSNTGAVWVWTRSDAVWTQQGTKLVGTSETGIGSQGISVALSSDGNTVIVGGISDNNGMGAAWVFTRSGGIWSQQGTKLVGSGASDASQGTSVALSSDGNTAIVGGYSDNSSAGAAWVWTRSGTTWTQQGAKLVGSGASGAARQGMSVALSSDGNTAIVGGSWDNSQAGAGWVWTRSGGVWTQQGSKLFGSGATGAAKQAQSVSISSDGNTAIIGGYEDNGGAGALWVFTRSGGIWTQQGSKLIGSGAAGNARQAWSVSLSSDGSTAIVGGFGDNNFAGAAWVFKFPAEPTISSITDIPSDQGGKVRVTWDKSVYDVLGSAHQITSYGLWREVPPGGVAMSLAPMSFAKSMKSAFVTAYDFIATVPAVRLDSYAFVAETLTDSTSSGTHRYVYMVSAHTADPTVFYISDLDSGYSVDNLPPTTPGNAQLTPLASGPVRVDWDRNRIDADVGHYALYRSTTDGFSIGDGTRLLTTSDTIAVDSNTVIGQTYYYRVTTVDIHDNESPPTSQLATTALSVQLASFTVRADRLDAILSWSTAIEKDNHGFDIERRTVGNLLSAVNWGKVGFVEGAGTSTSSREYSFADKNVAAGRYAYRIKQIDHSGSFAYTDAVELEVGLAPLVFALAQNYPNPFNPTTTIEFTLPQDGRVVLKIYDITGREVATLVDEERKAGVYHQAVFDASRLASGLYFSRLQSGGLQSVKKIVLLK